MTVTSRRLPNLVIAGVAKAGTTSLFSYLAQHPDVCAADEKELYFFSAPRFGEPLGPLDEYAAHFRHCRNERYVMEATPGYFFGGGPTIALMQRMLDDPRVLVSLRDPVGRFYSYYGFHQSRGDLPVDLAPAGYLQRCRELRASGVDGRRQQTAYWGLSGGCYADVLQAWLDAFGDRLHIVFFEDLQADAGATVAHICRWAGLSTEPLSGVDLTAANRTTRFRSPALRSLQLQLRERGTVLRRRAPRLYARAARTLLAVNATPEGIAPLDSDTRKQLEDFYAESNARVAAMLLRHGYRDLPDWLGPA